MALTSDQNSFVFSTCDSSLHVDLMRRPVRVVGHIVTRLPAAGARPRRVCPHLMTILIWPPCDAPWAWHPDRWWTWAYPAPGDSLAGLTGTTSGPGRRSKDTNGGLPGGGRPGRCWAPWLLHALQGRFHFLFPSLRARGQCLGQLAGTVGVRGGRIEQAERGEPPLVLLILGRWGERLHPGPQLLEKGQLVRNRGRGRYPPRPAPRCRTVRGSGCFAAPGRRPGRRGHRRPTAPRSWPLSSETQ
jgi:hypothetical protein